MSATAAARLLVLTVPILCVGLFARVLYTPDEPREASMIASMAEQADRALPELAGHPFAEKPPLLYWFGGASVAALGVAPWSARLPNLLYGLLAVLSVAALATRAAGPAAGFASGVVAATALQLHLVEIWLATDAPLLAGVALALLGAHMGLCAADRRARLRGYLVLHAGLAVAFFAKGFAGWLVPVPAYLVALAAERRFAELKRPALWAGAPLLVLLIGAWVLWVDAAPDGRESLKVLFWYNLVGRVVPIAAPTALDYASGHQNSAGKYLLELPLYLLPWTALALAALKRLPRGWRAPPPAGTGWRLAVGAIVPATVALSFAATARGVYFAPPLLGFALVIGLYCADAATALDRMERICWRATGLLIALFAALLGALAVVICLAPSLRQPIDWLLAALALGGGAGAAYLAASPPVTAAGAMPRYALALTLVLTLVCAPLYVRLNDWLSLEALAARAVAAAGPHPLLVLGADETTQAMVALYFPRIPAPRLISGHDGASLVAVLRSNGADARLVAPTKDPERWDGAHWLRFLGYLPPRAAPAATPAAEFAGLTLQCRIVRAGGRSLDVLALPEAGPAAGCP